MTHVKLPLTQQLIDETLKKCLPFIEDDLMRYGRCFIEVAIDPATDFLRARRIKPDGIEMVEGDT